jgi:hypothetical protein
MRGRRACRRELPNNALHRVAKDEASVYERGTKRRWLKVKQKNWTLEEDRWQRRILEEDRL